MAKPRNYWTKEKCHEVALECISRKEFSKKFNSAYAISSKNNWLSDICSHMKWKTKPMYYWTKDKCKEVSLNCSSRFEFQNKYCSAYRVAYKNKWLDDMCDHMKITGNIFKRLIYVCEFSDNFIYVGLTCNSERRNNEHIKDINSSVYKHTLETGLLPTYKELTQYLDVDIAGNIENFYIEKFEKLGYNLLNKKDGGGLGGGYIKWTYENCKNEALKYKSKTQFCKNKGRAYRKSVKEKWLNDFYPNN